MVCCFAKANCVGVSLLKTLKEFCLLDGMLVIYGPLSLQGSGVAGSRLLRGRSESRRMHECVRTCGRASVRTSVRVRVDVETATNCTHSQSDVYRIGHYWKEPGGKRTHVVKPSSSSRRWYLLMPLLLFCEKKKGKRRFMALLIG